MRNFTAEMKIGPKYNLTTVVIESSLEAVSISTIISLTDATIINTAQPSASPKSDRRMQVRSRLPEIQVNCAVRSNKSDYIDATKIQKSINGASAGGVA